MVQIWTKLEKTFAENSAYFCDMSFNRLTLRSFRAILICMDPSALVVVVIDMAVEDCAFTDVSEPQGWA